MKHSYRINPLLSLCPLPSLNRCIAYGLVSSAALPAASAGMALGPSTSLLPRPPIPPPPPPLLLVASPFIAALMPSSSLLRAHTAAMPIAINFLIGMAIMFFVEIESRMTSVERIQYYSSQLPQERQTGMVPPSSWPADGVVRFEHVSFRSAH